MRYDVSSLFWPLYSKQSIDGTLKLYARSANGFMQGIALDVLQSFDRTYVHARALLYAGNMILAAAEDKSRTAALRRLAASSSTIKRRVSVDAGGALLIRHADLQSTALSSDREEAEGRQNLLD
jgi:hypothetical protein